MTRAEKRAAKRQKKQAAITAAPETIDMTAGTPDTVAEEQPEPYETIVAEPESDGVQTDETPAAEEEPAFAAAESGTHDGAPAESKDDPDAR